MASQGISDNQLADFYVQQVKSYCDDSLSSVISKDWNSRYESMGIFNAPLKGIGFAFQSCWSSVSHAATSFKETLYNQISWEVLSTEKKQLCDEIQNQDFQTFDKLDTLGRNTLMESLERVDSQKARLMILAGVNPNSRNLISGSSVAHKLVTNGDVSKLNLLLTKGRAPDLNAPNFAGQTPLHIAAESGQPEILDILIQAGANLDISDHLGQTPLLLAAKNSFECFSKLVEAGANVYARDMNLSGVMHYAAQSDKSSGVVEKLYRKSYSQTDVDIFGNTPLHIAAQFSNHNFLNDYKYYFKFSNKEEDFGLNVNQVNQIGLAPIHIAALESSYEFVNALMKLGADPHMQAPFVLGSINPSSIKEMKPNHTPLMLAAIAGNSEVIRVLNLNYRGKVDELNDQGKTALMLAVENNQLESVQELLNQKADLNLPLPNGESLSYFALKNGFTELASLLIKNGGLVSPGEGTGSELLCAIAENDLMKVKQEIMKGASLNAVDGEGLTPFLLALATKNEKAISYFLEISKHSQDESMVSALDNKGRSALHFAAFNDADSDLIQAILDQGADPLSRDLEGQLALHHAVMSGNHEALSILSELEYPTNLGIDEHDSHKLSPLMYAVKNQDDHAVSLLINHGASPELITPEGQTSYHLAVLSGSQQTLAALLAAQPKGLSWTDASGKTPYDLAFSKKDDAMCQMLANAGSKTNAYIYDGFQKLVLGAKSQEEILKQQVTGKGLATAMSYGSPALQIDLSKLDSVLLNYRDDHDNTPSLLAAASGKWDQVMQFINLGVDVNAQNKAGWSLIHFAAKQGKDEALEALALNGANLNVCLKTGVTPYALALSENKQSTVDLLSKLGASQNLLHISKNERLSPSYALINFVRENDEEAIRDYFYKGGISQISDDGQWNALHHAVLDNQNSEIISLLSNHGVDVNQQDSEYHTPLSLAVLLGNKEAVSHLCQLTDLDVEDSEELHEIAKRFKRNDMLEILNKC